MVEQEQSLFYELNVKGTEELDILKRLEELEQRVSALEITVSQIIENSITEEDIDELFEV